MNIALIVLSALVIVMNVFYINMMVAVGTIFLMNNGDLVQLVRTLA